MVANCTKGSNLFLDRAWDYLYKLFTILTLVSEDEGLGLWIVRYFLILPYSSSRGIKHLDTRVDARFNPLIKDQITQNPTLVGTFETIITIISQWVEQPPKPLINPKLTKVSSSSIHNKCGVNPNPIMVKLDIEWSTNTRTKIIQILRNNGENHKQAQK